MRKVLLLCLVTALAAGFWTKPVQAQPTPLISGTWFGTIVLTDPTGKSTHDTAVLIIQNSGTTFSGSMGRTIDQMTPWTGGSLKDNRLAFHLDAAGGLNISLTRIGDRLAGSATGQSLQAEMNLTPAPGLLPHDQLQQEITWADQQLYKAFETCDLPGYAALLSNDLEFFQDHTGKTGYEENLKALQNRCTEGIKLRRALDQDSLLVNAVPGFGAIQAGTQHFYATAPDGQEHLEATARFTNVWSKASGTWKLVRVISYDHR